MADNVVLNPGSGGASVATDDILGIHHQRVKIQHGADGSATDVSSASPLPVEAASLPLPTGAATAANQTTIIGHLDGLEGLLTTIDADTGVLAGAVRAEDAVHQSGDTGIMALAVRQDADAALAANGDYHPLQLDSEGRLKVECFPSGSIFPVEGADAHDAAVSNDPMLAGGVAQANDDTAPPNRVSAEGDATRLACTLDGALHTVPHPPQIWSVSNRYTTQQTDATVKAAPGAGLKLYITDIFFAADGVVDVTLEQDVNVFLWEYYAQAAGDGASSSFRTPIQLAANAALEVTTSAAITCTLVVTGYTAP